MSNQLFTDGDTFEHKGETLECVFVQYRDVNNTDGQPTGAKENFVYAFRLKSELDAERKEQRQIEEDQVAARTQAEQSTNEQTNEGGGLV